MRCYNCLLCPKISIVLWLALQVLVSPAFGQSSNARTKGQVAVPIVSNSPQLANRLPQPHASALQLAEISEGISIAKQQPGRWSWPQANSQAQASTMYQNLPLTPTSTPGLATSDQTPEMPTSPVAVSNAAAKEDVQLAGLTRPLHSINLADAATAESLAGEELRQPSATSGNFQFNNDTIVDTNRSLSTPLPWRVSQPVWYNPLYFEDANLERCGQHHGILTEPVSLLKFFGRMPVVPYLAASNPPNSCVRSLGDCPTCHSFGIDAYLPPLDAEASAVQAAATVGLIFLIP